MSSAVLETESISVFTDIVYYKESLTPVGDIATSFMRGDPFSQH